VSFPLCNSLSALLLSSNFATACATAFIINRYPRVSLCLLNAFWCLCGINATLFKWKCLLTCNRISRIEEQTRHLSMRFIFRLFFISCLLQLIFRERAGHCLSPITSFADVFDCCYSRCNGDTVSVFMSSKLMTALFVFVWNVEFCCISIVIAVMRQSHICRVRVTSPSNSGVSIQNADHG